MSEARRDDRPEYRIESACGNELTAIDRLERLVANRMAEGWRPFGGVSISHRGDNGNMAAAQAMVRGQIR